MLDNIQTHVFAHTHTHFSCRLRIFSGEYPFFIVINHIALVYLGAQYLAKTIEIQENFLNLPLGFRERSKQRLSNGPSVVT